MANQRKSVKQLSKEERLQRLLDRENGGDNDNEPNDYNVNLSKIEFVWKPEYWRGVKRTALRTFTTNRLRDLEVVLTQQGDEEKLTQIQLIDRTNDDQLLEYWLENPDSISVAEFLELCDPSQTLFIAIIKLVDNLTYGSDVDTLIKDLMENHLTLDVERNNLMFDKNKAEHEFNIALDQFRAKETSYATGKAAAEAEANFINNQLVNQGREFDQRKLEFERQTEEANRLLLAERQQMAQEREEQRRNYDQLLHGNRQQNLVNVNQNHPNNNRNFNQNQNFNIQQQRENQNHNFHPDNFEFLRNNNHTPAGSEIWDNRSQTTVNARQPIPQPVQQPIQQPIPQIPIIPQQAQQQMSLTQRRKLKTTRRPSSSLQFQSHQ